MKKLLIGLTLLACMPSFALESVFLNASCKAECRYTAKTETKEGDTYIKLDARANVYADLNGITRKEIDSQKKGELIKACKELDNYYASNVTLEDVNCIITKH